MCSKLCYGKATNLGHRTREQAWEPPQTRPESEPFKSGKRSGMARGNGPKTDQKRSRLGAENGASESGKERPWQSFGKATRRSHRTRREAWASAKTRPQSGPPKTAKHSHIPFQTRKHQGTACRVCVRTSFSGARPRSARGRQIIQLIHCILYVFISLKLFKLRQELLLSPENVGGESGAWAPCSGNEAAAAALREVPKRATPQRRET